MNNKGFTLFEILVYVAISTVVAGLAVGSLLSFTRIGQRESSSAAVTGEMNFVLQRIQQLVSESANIDIDAGVSASTVKLRMQDSAKDPTCISLINGVIKLAEGPGSPNLGDCNSTASDLTSSKVVVNSLNFKKLVQYPGHDTLSVDMTISYNTLNPQSQVQKTLSTAIARVSAATFDANLLPGSDNQYEVGYTGQRWKNISISNLLNVGQLSTDPTSGMQNGSIYYNTTSNVLRNYQNGAWASVGGGPWQSSSTSIYYNSGNVGIGTAAPTRLLDIAKTGSYAPLSLRRTDNANGYALGELEFRGLDSTGGDIAYASITGYSDDISSTSKDSKINFYTHSNNAETLTMSMISGNVGIGTASPGYKLEVAGTIFSSSGGFRFPDGTTQTSKGYSGQLWRCNCPGYYYFQGYVLLDYDQTGTACATSAPNWSCTQIQ